MPMTRNITAYFVRIHMLIFSQLDREGSLKSEECEGYMMILKMSTEYFQLKVLQHLFTRSHSLDNAFKQM